MNQKLADFSLDRPLVVGIVNVTPDSFSDGGETLNHDLAIRRGLEHIRMGADFVDIGGQSSRPGSKPVGVVEELKRILPVVKTLASEGVVVSLDTYRAEVMSKGLDAGAKIINDITALTWEKKSFKLVVERNTPVILMHMQRAPHSNKKAVKYMDVVGEVEDFLTTRINKCISAGYKIENLCIDPGIGFDKTVKENFELLNNLGSLVRHRCPVMVGVSRKFGLQKPSRKRLNESISIALHCLNQGAKILRVHDVRQTKVAVQNWLVSRNFLK